MIIWRFQDPKPQFEAMQLFKVSLYVCFVIPHQVLGQSPCTSGASRYILVGSPTCGQKGPSPPLLYTSRVTSHAYSFYIRNMAFTEALLKKYVRIALSPKTNKWECRTRFGDGIVHSKCLEKPFCSALP